MLENTLSGDAIDVLKFPVPKVHELDGGPGFIGTACIAVTRDPEEGWLNLGTYRAMVHDAKIRGAFHVVRVSAGRLAVHSMRACPTIGAVSFRPSRSRARN